MQTQALATTHSLSSEDLIAAQRSIELRASQDGYERYIKHQQSACDSMGDSASSEAMKLIRGAIPLVSEKIAAWVASNTKPGPGKRHAALSTLQRFDPDLLAFITLNSIFAGITRTNTLTSIHTTLGGQVEAEVMAQDIEDLQGRKVAARIRMVTAKQGSARNKRKSFNKIAKEQLPEHQSWDQATKVRIAEPLVSAALQALPELLEIATISVGKDHTNLVLRLTEEGVQMFGRLRESMAWMQPIHRPMVVPPMSTGAQN